MSLGQIINFKIMYVGCILFLLDTAVVDAKDIYMESHYN